MLSNRSWFAGGHSYCCYMLMMTNSSLALFGLVVVMIMNRRWLHGCVWDDGDDRWVNECVDGMLLTVDRHHFSRAQAAPFSAGSLRSDSAVPDNRELLSFSLISSPISSGSIRHQASYPTPLPLISEGLASLSLLLMNNRSAHFSSRQHPLVLQYCVVILPRWLWSEACFQMPISYGPWTALLLP